MGLGIARAGQNKDTLPLNTAGLLCGWALCGWALQGYSAVGHCRKTWRLGIAGIFGGFCNAGILGA